MMVTSGKTWRVALVGYGQAGRIFHAPLIAGVPGLQLACICSSQTAAVRADWPQASVLAEPEVVFADPQIDVVVIATPNSSHYPLARAALLAGKHVVVDKPCTTTLAQTLSLLDLARQQNRVLTVFQNRRLDSDFLSLRQVLAQGLLGRVVHVASHFDRYRPMVPHRWREQDLPGSGLWLDLGAHLVDQVLQLFGPPEAMALALAVQRDGACVNDWFHAQLRYDGRHPGLRVILHGSTLVPAPGPRWTVHGTLGSFTKYGLDPQEDALKAGRRPQFAALQDWGQDRHVGELLRYQLNPGQPPEGLQPVRHAAPAVRGNYLSYYDNLRAALAGESSPMVSPQQVQDVMRLLSLGEQSAQEGRWLAW
jgi:predicted dehydrogenase